MWHGLLQDGMPIALEGKHMSPAGQNYDMDEKEMLAVIHQSSGGVTLTVWSSQQ